jgi:hypothetical protein
MHGMHKFERTALHGQTVLATGCTATGSSTAPELANATQQHPAPAASNHRPAPWSGPAAARPVTHARTPLARRVLWAVACRKQPLPSGTSVASTHSVLAKHAAQHSSFCCAEATWAMAPSCEPVFWIHVQFVASMGRNGPCPLPLCAGGLGGLGGGGGGGDGEGAAAQPGTPQIGPLPLPPRAFQCCAAHLLLQGPSM